MIDLKQWMSKMSSGLNAVISRTNRRWVSIPADSSFSASTFVVEIHRIGNLADIYMNINVPALAAGTEQTMFVIPSSFMSPVGKYNFTVNGQVDAMYLIQVYMNGTVTIYSPKATTAQFMRGMFVIPCSGGVNRYGINGFAISLEGRWQDAGCEVYAGKNLRSSLCHRDHICEKLDGNLLVSLWDCGNRSCHNTSRDVYRCDNHTSGVGRFWSRVFRSIRDGSSWWRNIHTVDTNIPVSTGQAVYFPVGQRYFLIHREGFNENYQDKIRTTSERRWAA